MTKVIASGARRAHSPAMRIRITLLALVVSVVALPLLAHCDWITGPVVTDARAALAAGDVAGVLKWVAPADEKELRDAFARTLKVRAQGAEARELADLLFFETLVRLHRQSEGDA